MFRRLAARTSLSIALALLLSATAAADTASQVFDLWPGSDPGVPSFDAAVFGAELCFRGRNDFAALDATGDELYCYDGTTVTLAADILPGATGSFPLGLTVYDGQLYFSAENPLGNNELWRWDGTNPPVEVFDLQAGGESAPRELTVYDGQLYFSADDDGASGGRALWRYDSSQPTVIGTNPFQVQDFGTTDLQTPRDWLVFAGLLFYPGPTGNGHGAELFRFDSSQPIVDGTNPRILVDLNPGPPGSDPLDLTAHSDGNFYFTAVPPLDVGRRLYRSNGSNVPTPLSTTLDIQGNIASFGGELLFFAQNQDLAELTGTELWRYDGTSFERVEPGVEYLTGEPFGEIDGLLYFIASRGNALNGFDLYKYDGSGPPAPAVALFSTIGDENYPIFGFAEFDGRLYFNARSTAGGAELWALEAQGGPPPGSGGIVFGTSTFSASEGAGSASIVFFRNGGTAGAISACFATSDGTATEGDDYSAVSTIVSFGDGESAPVTIPVPLLDDTGPEASETVILTLSIGGLCGDGPIGGPTSTLTILDDDGPPPVSAIQLSAATYLAGEGDGLATLAVTRTAPFDETCVDVTVTPGSATAVDDYDAIASFTVSWGLGDALPKTFDITVIDDPFPEGDETVEVQLSLSPSPNCGATLGTPDSATLTIVDNDGVAGPVAIPTVSEWGLLLLAAALALLALPRLRG